MSRLVLLSMSAAVLLLTGCAGARSHQRTAAGGDAEFARMSRLAHAAYDKGSLAQAETLYRQAQRRARERDDAADLGDAAYNLAAVLIARDRPTEAGPLLDEAEAELQRAGQTPTDVWLVKARLAVGEKKNAAALNWLEAIEQSRGATSAQHAQAALLRGEIACLEKDSHVARQQLNTARQQAGAARGMLAAGREKLSGQVALLEGKPAAAAIAFDREAEWCRQSGQHRAMAQALARAGDAYAQAGEKRAGADRLYRAARSFLAQGHTSAAQPLIARAEQWAGESGDAALRTRLRQLAAEAGSMPR